MEKLILENQLVIMQALSCHPSGSFIAQQTLKEQIQKTKAQLALL